MESMMDQYIADYQAAREAGKETRTLRRQYVEMWKLANARCKDCKNLFPPHILQFDHVRGDKIGNISDLCRTGTMEELQLEIDKCDVVCANCHSHRTFMRSVNNPRKG